MPSDAKTKAEYQRRYVQTESGQKSRRAITARWRDKNPDYARNRHLERTYGITREQYDAMLESQGGGCAICDGPPRKRKMFSVDHDHTTGEVRALLCNPCNAGIGLLDDDPEKVRKALAYLLKHKKD